MINWTVVNRTDYENQRYAFLVRTEESGTPKLSPYNDGIGNITIGVGFFRNANIFSLCESYILVFSSILLFALQ